LFVGPVVLAVTFRLAQAWVNEGPPQPAAAAQSADAQRNASA